jgi:carbamoyltransferase
VFVQPAAHDAGTALGAAILSSVKRSGETRVAFRTTMLGTEHEDAAIVATCRAAGIDCPRPGAAELVEEVAERLAAGQVGGVFRGRMEFGPRALGHRSVLADPRDPGMRDRLNRIKGRESFRPVAPIVAVEAFDTYFDGERNPYMLFTTRVRSETRDIIPSAVHADGTARVQTMSHQDDPWLAQLLRAFDARTGVPVLINTSLNVRGKPIVESPAEALACLFTTDMDFLVLGDRLIARTPLRQPVPGDASVGSEERRESRGQ